LKDVRPGLDRVVRGLLRQVNSDTLIARDSDKNVFSKDDHEGERVRSKSEDANPFSFLGARASKQPTTKDTG
jgi:hypothetical protein